MAFFLPSLSCRRFLASVVCNHQHGIRRRVSTYSVFVSTLNGASRYQHGSSHTLQSAILRAVRNKGGPEKRGFSFFMKGATVAGLGLGLASVQKPPIQCDAPLPQVERDPIYPNDRPPPPSSSVSLYELGFGTVAGFCAGVFVKKGAKAVAWFLGGIFVLLQYLGSASLIHVDWGRMSIKFENLFHKKDASGATKPPTILSLWNWMVNFLTADFQPRASFIAGFVLGLRIG